MFLHDMVFGWSSRDARMGYEERLDGSSSISKSPLRKRIVHYGNWNPTFSRLTISFHKRLVPSFTCQMFGMSVLDFIHLCFVSFMHRSMSSLQKDYIISSVFIGVPLYLLTCSLLDGDHMSRLLVTIGIECSYKLGKGHLQATVY